MNGLENTSVEGVKLLLNVVFRIAIPSILFALIEFFPKKMIRGEEVGLTNMLVETFGGCTYWFTSALLVAELILLLLLLIRIKDFVFFFICAIIIWSIGTYLKQNSLYIFGYAYFPWYYSRGMIAVLYLTMGGLYWKYEDRINSYIGENNLLTVAVSLFLYIAAIWTVTQIEDNVQKTIGLFFRNFLGIFGVIRACLMTRDNKWLSFIGVNSLGFYLLSGSIPNILSILFCRMTFIPIPIAFSAVFLFSVVSAYVAVRIFTKYAPWLFDLRLLYRKR